MSELFHNLGAPLRLSSSGGLEMVSGTAQGHQKIVRRILTSTRDLMQFLKYGASIPRMVGSPGYEPSIQAIITEQMRLEPIVVQSPPPIISVTSDGGNGLYQASIVYTDNTTLEQVQIKIPNLSRGAT